MPGGTEAGRPFLSAVPGARNLTILGPGTIDGSGDLWWGGRSQPLSSVRAARARGGSGHCSDCPPRRPYLLHLPSAFDVRLQGVTLMNGPAWHAGKPTKPPNHPSACSDAR